MNALVKKWRDISRRDDCFNHMVPSDVRVLLMEIERLESVLENIAYVSRKSSLCDAERLDDIRRLKTSVSGNEGQSDANSPE